MKLQQALSPLYALVLAAALLPGGARAEVDALVRDALALAEGGNGKQAFAMLEPQEVTRAGDPDFDTVFGIAANQSGEYVRAILALERVLIVQPGNTRARAELGRAMFAVGDAKSARTLLDQAKAQGAPAEASALIDQFLRAIDQADAAAKSSWNGYVDLGIGSDNNVSTGPANANVAVPVQGGSINFTLNPNNVKKQAHFFSVGGGVSGRYIIDSRLSVIGGANASVRKHPGDSVFNNSQLAINGGVSYRVDKQEFSAVLTHDDYWVDGSTARSQNGVVGEWQDRLSETSQAGAYLQYSRLHYPGQSTRDTNRTVAGGSYAQQLGSGLVAYGGLYLGREQETDSAFPHNGHRLYGLRLGGQMTLNPTLSAFAGINYEHRRYGGVNPTFGVVRSDNQSGLLLGMNWAATKEWRVTPLVSYTRVKSNIPISDYDRTLLSVTARYEF